MKRTLIKVLTAVLTVLFVTASSSKKTYSMPAPDDYEDFDDFMDDWDGCMPDGSDAEDYWDNW